LTLTVITVFVNIFITFFVSAYKFQNAVDATGNTLVGAVFLPLIITWIVSRLKRNRNAETFTKILLIVSLIVMLSNCGNMARVVTERSRTQGNYNELRSDYYDEKKVKYDRNISPPSSPILFQPMFVWNDTEPTFQGTGFFVLSSDKRTAAVTSSHFIDADGSHLRKAYWLNIVAQEKIEPVAYFTRIWGKLGNGGSDSPTDLRSDYLIMPPENVVPDSCVLELDSRVRLKAYEGVWFPNKDSRSSTGYTLVDGMVTETQKNYHTVVLRDYVEFQSQSGSPIISKITGRVIGTLSRAGYTETNKPIMYLAPSHSIKDAVDEDAEFPDLFEAIGKK